MNDDVKCDGGRFTYEEDGWSVADQWRSDVFPLYTHFSVELAGKVLRNLHRLDEGASDPFCYLLVRASAVAAELVKVGLQDRDRRALFYPWLEEALNLLKLYPDDETTDEEFSKKYSVFQSKEVDRMCRYFRFEIERIQKLPPSEAKGVQLKRLVSLLHLWGAPSEDGR